VNAAVAVLLHILVVWLFRAGRRSLRGSHVAGGE